MKLLITLYLLLLALAPKVMAYNPEDLTACILSAQSNPEVAGAKESSIEGFCDCALKAIIDEGKDQNSSAKKCAQKNFKN